MGILVLSTLERVRRAANKTGTVTSDDDLLLSALASASQAMQSYCSMQWARQSGIVETRACAPSGILMLRAKPVVSIASVQVLSRGQLTPRDLLPTQFALFDGNELHYPGGLGPLDRVITTYDGGVAESTEVSTESVKSVTGTPTPGDAITSSTARASLVSFDGQAMTAKISVTDGTLSAGSTITGPGDTPWTMTLGDTLIPSIISDYCDLANACDQQACYIYQRRNTPGRKVVQSGQGNTTFEDSYQLLPGVKEILEYYDHQFLG